MAKRVQTWKEFWDALATSRNPIAATDRPTVPPSTYQLYSTEIIQKLDLNRDDILLDIGCGTGIIDASLAPHVRKIFATDFSQIMAEKTRSNTATWENVHAVNCDGAALPFRDGIFPKVVVYAVAQYLSRNQIDQVLGEAHRVTQSGGLIMLGEIPRARDASLPNRVRDVWRHQGLRGVLRKILDLSFEFWLRVTGCLTHRFVRPESPPIVLHSEKELLDMVHQHGMCGQVLRQSEKLPWFHQTFDLLIENIPVADTREDAPVNAAKSRKGSVGRQRGSQI